MALCTFRRFVFESSCRSRFEFTEERLAAVRDDDVELLRLGLAWINAFLFGQGSLRPVARGMKDES